MRTVVIAGTTVITPQLIGALHSRGHDVVTAMPGRCFDPVTGEGLTPFLSGAGVVIDVSEPPMRGGESVVQRVAASTRVLLEHECVALVDQEFRVRVQHELIADDRAQLIDKGRLIA